MRREPDSLAFHVFVTNQLCDLGQVITPASKVVLKIIGNGGKEPGMKELLKA